MFSGGLLNDLLFVPGAELDHINIVQNWIRRTIPGHQWTMEHERNQNG